LVIHINPSTGEVEIVDGQVTREYEGAITRMATAASDSNRRAGEARIGIEQATYAPVGKRFRGPPFARIPGLIPARYSGLHWTFLDVTARYTVARLSTGAVDTTEPLHCRIHSRVVSSFDLIAGFAPGFHAAIQRNCALEADIPQSSGRKRRDAAELAIREDPSGRIR
jgi:hypothetical protein